MLQTTVQRVHQRRGRRAAGGSNGVTKGDLQRKLQDHRLGAKVSRLQREMYLAAHQSHETASLVGSKGKISHCVLFGVVHRHKLYVLCLLNTHVCVYAGVDLSCVSARACVPMCTHTLKLTMVASQVMCVRYYFMYALRCNLVALYNLMINFTCNLLIMCLPINVKYTYYTH